MSGAQPPTYRAKYYTRRSTAGRPLVLAWLSKVTPDIRVDARGNAYIESYVPPLQDPERRPRQSTHPGNSTRALRRPEPQGSTKNPPTSIDRPDQPPHNLELKSPDSNSGTFVQMFYDTRWDNGSAPSEGCPCEACRDRNSRARSSTVRARSPTRSSSWPSVNTTGSNFTSGAQAQPTNTPSISNRTVPQHRNVQLLNEPDSDKPFYNTRWDNGSAPPKGCKCEPCMNPSPRSSRSNSETESD